METIHIYTDGACSGNPGPGGAAAILIRDGKIYHRVGRGYKMTTNNRMEILAVTYGAKAALQRIPEPSGIIFHTDSQIVYGGLALGWKKNANKDLWKELDTVLTDLRKTHKVHFEKAKGHSDDMWNNAVDALAVKLRMLPEKKLLEDSEYGNNPGAEAHTLFSSAENDSRTNIEYAIRELVRRQSTENDISMAEILAKEPVPAGVTFKKAFGIYVGCMKQVEGDKFLVIRNNEQIEL